MLRKVGNGTHDIKAERMPQGWKDKGAGTQRDMSRYDRGDE